MTDKPTGTDAGRPMRADAQRNRAKVLEAAQQAFAEEGLSVPLDEIARRAGVGAGTVYRHFPNKELLFEAIVLSRLEGLVNRAAELAGADDAGAAFFDFLRLMLDETTLKRDLIDALSGSDLSGPITKIRRDMRTAIGRLLVRAQEAGTVRADIEITSLMRLLSGIFLTVAQTANQGGPDEHVVSVIFDGLRAGRS